MVRITTLWLTLGTSIPLFCCLAVAQEITTSSGASPLTSIIESIEKTQAGVGPKVAYQVIREYRLFGANDSTANSDVLAEVDFRPPALKDYKIQKSSGSEGKHQKHVKGTGLGLPLSRKFAQLLGGDVSVSSQIGVGSTFFATIPVSVAAERPEVTFLPRTQIEIHADKLPVLVVEDNPEALFIYDKCLKDTQFQMIPARNLKEARSALIGFRPKAIVLDVLLQGEHSWELLHDLKQDSATRHIPVFVITVVENRQKALGLGADAFSTKPAERSWLLAQLEALVSVDKPPHVLVIDDDEVARYVLRSLTANQQFRFTEATDGRQGLQLAREVKPDIIILDLKMPDLSGFEVLKALKLDAETSGIPVIIYTSKVLDPSDRRALEQSVSVLSKDNSSREESLEKFAEAFEKAGVRFSSSVGEGQHV